MIVPPILKSGSKFHIVSPAGNVKEKLVFPIVKWLKQQGYKVEVGKYAFERHFQFAGTDAQRLHDLQTALDDPECSTIICSRGGYGTVRIIDQLDFSEFKKYPKWLVGFSDVTILHSCLNNLGFVTIHGAMPPFFLDKNEEANENLTSVIDLLNRKKISYKIATNRKNKIGNITGRLIGGNLSIITSLFGTGYELETAGKILFIEETDEYLYHIDRMLHQLKLAGKFDDIAGLVIGSFTGTKDNDSPFGQTVEDIILKVVEDYDFPICFGFPAGHDKKNLALAFGRNWELDISEDQSTLKLI